MLTEQFKPIKGYENLYEISNFGRVKSLSRISMRKGLIAAHIREKILKTSNDGDGYRGVTLFLHGVGKTFRIHRLVWDAWGSEPREGYKLQVDHIDGDKVNNNIENLQLLNGRQNTCKGYSSMKRSGLPTGVYLNKKRRKYLSSIMINGKRINLGSFDNIPDAEAAYKSQLRNIPI